MLRIARSPAARADLVNHYVYLEQEGGIQLAERFLHQVQTSFTLLTTQPDMGPRIELPNPKLAGLRKWRIKDFERFLIFYAVDTDRISIVRILHASQDWWEL